MTLSDAITYVRNRNNAASDTFWSDSEILKLIEARTNEIVSVIGLMEATSSTTVSVNGTQAYSFPTDFEFIKRVQYDGTDIQQIDFRDWDVLKINGLTPSGTPRYFVIWNQQVNLIPIPDASSKVIKFYGEKKQASLTTTGDTWVLPAILHARCLDGVIADMFAKDEKVPMSRLYEEKWLNVHIPAFYTYKQQARNRGRYPIVKDSDTSINSDFGVR